MQDTTKRKPRFSLVFEPETLERIGRHAERHFKGNKSLVVQIAVDRYLHAEDEEERALRAPNGRDESEAA